VQGSWAPDRNDEYLFYQSLVGAWPAETLAEPVAARAPADLVGRLLSYMTKATREAKVHTSWIHVNAEYERAVEHFVEATLTGPASARFLAAFVPFQRRVAAVGMVNSLAQLTLKLTSPGVPDFYQGTELWDLSLVDPDNRRAVDFAARHALLEDLQPLIDRLDADAIVDREVNELLERWPDGRIKLLIATRGLRFRRAQRELLLTGGYSPLHVEGPAADRLVAFARTDDSGTLLTIVPRLVASLSSGDGWLPRGHQSWSSTEVLLPGTSGTRFRHLVTGEVIQETNGRLPAAQIFRTSPVAMLWAPHHGPNPV
jgi:(1->4)-alpha-D-glucan 1-alpha-D-glucosylmutase